MDMGGKSCRFIGQPSQLVHSFDSSYHILMAGHPKSMKLTVVMMVVVVREMEEEGRRWRGKKSSKHCAQWCHVWLGKAAPQPREAGSSRMPVSQHLGSI
jgi:hypothetical protein